MSESTIIPDPWDELRRVTPARIGLGRRGGAQPTSARLSFAAAHAAARDAVHSEIPDHVVGTRITVRSQASDRAEYLRRPDLGRLPNSEDLAGLPTREGGWDVGIILADGLSPEALTAHGEETESALRDALSQLAPNLSVAPTVWAQQARVALGDHIAQAMGVRVIIVVIGERPGLSVPHSLGMYLTLNAVPGTTDERCNCISNVHPPDGLSYIRAAVTAVDLAGRVLELGESGARVKASLVSEQSARSRMQIAAPDTASHTAAL